MSQFKCSVKMLLPSGDRDLSILCPVSVARTYLQPDCGWFSKQDGKITEIGVHNLQLCSSPNIIIVIKSGRMKYKEHVARLEEVEAPSHEHV
jgi:hypothetical protein